MDYECLIVFGIALVAWLIFLQPIIQLYLLFRKARSKVEKAIGLISLFINFIFLTTFFYGASFKGAFNISGHGTSEPMPSFLIETIFISFIASLLFFVIFIVTLVGGRLHAARIARGA